MRQRHHAVGKPEALRIAFGKNEIALRQCLQQPVEGGAAHAQKRRGPALVAAGCGQGIFKADVCTATAESVMVLMDDATHRAKSLTPQLRGWLEARLAS